MIAFTSLVFLLFIFKNFTQLFNTTLDMNFTKVAEVVFKELRKQPFKRCPVEELLRKTCSIPQETSVLESFLI